MKLETISEIDFIKNNLKILSYAEIAEKLNRGYDVIKHKIKSLGLVEYEMGKNPNSRKKKIYSCNHQSFRLLNEDVCYWAGFIAADGSIGKDLNTVSFCLASRDKDHLIAFNEFIESDKIILEGQAKYKYKNIESFKSYASLTILSPLIVDDLKNNFNIVNKKSLILEPPHLTDRAHIDAYIKGYIDGDGTVALKNSKNGKVLYITALGTKAVMSWIAKRFGECFQITMRHEDFKTAILQSFTHKIVRSITSGNDGMFDKIATELKQDSIFRAKATIAITEIVDNYLKERVTNE